MSNNRLGHFEDFSYSFFSLNTNQVYFSDIDQEFENIMRFWIVEDANMLVISRDVENIWDALASAGGFYEVICIMAISFIFHF